MARATKKTAAARKSAAASRKARAARKAAPLVMVIEGDSWEHLPDFGLKALPIVGGANYDLSRALMGRGHTIYNLAYWGDTIADIAAAGDYLKTLRHTRAPLLLLGGGGNDLLGGGALKRHLRLFAPERTPKDYILDTFYGELRQVILHYEAILGRIAEDALISGTRVIVHGYDYARPMRLGWLGDPMEFVGIGWDRPDLQDGIVKIMIDALNDELKALAGRRNTVVYVDFRGTVGRRWHDELHPTRAAFEELAALLEGRL
jgi:hypothetical protein